MPLVDDVLTDMAKNVILILTACVFVVVIPLQYLLKAMAFFPSRFLESMALFETDRLKAMMVMGGFVLMSLASLAMVDSRIRVLIHVVQGHRVHDCSELREELTAVVGGTVFLGIATYLCW
jgi:hypothetical protein